MLVVLAVSVVAAAGAGSVAAVTVHDRWKTR
jgi:hypothetical protein